MAALQQKCNAVIGCYIVSDLLDMIVLMETGSRASHQ